MIKSLKLLKKEKIPFLLKLPAQTDLKCSLSMRFNSRIKKGITST